MKKIITFAIQKGGTGKTSNAVSVAMELSMKGKKTLIIDADPQGNATSWLNVGEIKNELADVLNRQCEAKDAITNVVINGDETLCPNLFFIPTASLGSSLRLYSKTTAVENPYGVRKLLRSIKDDFDYTIIDTSPAFGALEESCLLASDEAVTVLNIDEFSNDGLITFIDNLAKMKDRLDVEKPLLKTIILNGRDLRLVQQKDYIERITQSVAGKVQLFIVPIDQAFKKAQSIHIPLQFLEGAKKETLKVIGDIASSLSKEEAQ